MADRIIAQEIKIPLKSVTTFEQYRTSLNNLCIWFERHHHEQAIYNFFQILQNVHNVSSIYFLLTLHNIQSKVDQKKKLYWNKCQQQFGVTQINCVITNDIIYTIDGNESDYNYHTEASTRTQYFSYFCFHYDCNKIILTTLLTISSISQRFSLSYLIILIRESNIDKCTKLQRMMLQQQKDVGKPQLQLQQIEPQLQRRIKMSNFQIPKSKNVMMSNDNFIKNYYPLGYKEKDKVENKIKENFVKLLTITTIQLIFLRLKYILLLLLRGDRNQILDVIIRKFYYKYWNWENPKILGIFYVLIIMTGQCSATRQDVPTNCTFPQKWEGSWFLSGYQQAIQIRGSRFSYRGKCTASDGNKYLIVDEKGCHRCLVIYEKHKNVLQYKESECEGDSLFTDHSNDHSNINNNKGNNVVAHSNNNNKNNNGINISGSSSSHTKLLSSPDQYTLRSNGDRNDCYFCRGREALQTLCDQIPGDALLYSLFKEEAEPVTCPLKGPFTFTYNRGHGECKSPVSNIDSCTEESRLLLSFQACPDVQGTESTVEELTCLATWKDGNSRYLVGLVSHHHAISNEERFRCFVYEKISSMMSGYPGSLSSHNLKDAEYKLAQSGDATCNGLDSAEVGSRIMTLRKPPTTERCDFPLWFKSQRHWHALMGNTGYQYSSDGSLHIKKPNGYMDTRALCEQINKQTTNEMMAVVHYTTGCKSGFMCMMFYRRDTHIAEIQTGTPATRLEDACAPDHFDVSKIPYITLLASNAESEICPLYGLYHLRGAIGPPYITSRHKRNHSNKNHNPSSNEKQHSNNSNKDNQRYHKKYLDDESLQRHKRHESSNEEKSHKLHLVFELENKQRKSYRRTASHSNSSLSEDRFIYDYLSSNNNSSNGVVAAVGMNNSSIKITITEQSKQILNETQRNRRNAPGCIVDYKVQRQLRIGCAEQNQIDVRPLCSDSGDEVYLCHGSWTENDTTYVIAKHSGTQHTVCLTYKQLERKAARLFIGDSCHRGNLKLPDHHLAANLTNFGKCGDSSMSIKITNDFSTTKICLFFVLVFKYLISTCGR